MEWAILAASAAITIIAGGITAITVRALALAEKLEPFDAKTEADRRLLKQADEMEKAARRLDWGDNQYHAKERWEEARKIRESVRPK